MILLIRTAHVFADPRQSSPWAVRMAEIATARTSAPVAVWASVSGAPAGTLLFSCFYQNLAEQSAATATLMADADYLAGIAEAKQHLVGPPDDKHVEILHTAGGEYKRPPVGGLVQLTVATPNPGRIGAAVTWGLEITELVAEILGVPVMFGRSLAGPFGELNWLGASADAAGADLQREALTKDSRYLTKVDESGDVFRADSAQVQIVRRIA